MFLRNKTKVMYWALLLTDFLPNVFYLLQSMYAPN